MKENPTTKIAEEVVSAFSTLHPAVLMNYQQWSDLRDERYFMETNPGREPRQEADMVKPHYFQQEHADLDDTSLGTAIWQGYVPAGCLLGGSVVMGEVNAGRSPCWDCAGPREALPWQAPA
jgi:hypothetical protein